MTHKKTHKGKGSMPSAAKKLVVVQNNEPAADAAPAPTARPEELRLLEALLFAAGEPLDEAMLARRLPDGVNVKTTLAQLRDEYATRGVNLVRVGKKWTFRTATDLSWLLTKGPLLADAHKVDATRRVFVAKLGKRRFHIDPIGKPARQHRFVERLARREQQGFEQPQFLRSGGRSRRSVCRRLIVLYHHELLGRARHGSLPLMSFLVRHALWHSHSRRRVCACRSARMTLSDESPRALREPFRVRTRTRRQTPLRRVQAPRRS